MLRSILLTCLVAAAPFAVAQVPKPITAEDLWAAQRLGAPSLSPDGRRAVVEVTTYDIQENSASSDLWILDTEGAPPRRLTFHPGRSSHPKWSPDGRWIAFTAKRDKDDQAQAYLIAPDGGEARRLTSLSTGVSAPTWSSDGRRLLFVSWVWPDLSGDEAQQKRLKARADSKVKALTFDRTTLRYWDHWLGDGRVPRVFAVEVSGGPAVDLMAGLPANLHLPLQDPGEASYDLSPDGRELAFVADLGKDPGADPNPDLVLLDLGTRIWKNLSADHPAEDIAPRFSPDGRWLAYLRGRVPHAPTRNLLTLLDRRSGVRRTLAEAWDRSPGRPAWAPDGRSLLFGAEDEGRHTFWRLGLDAALPEALAQGGTVTDAVLSRDGKRLVFGRSTQDRPTVILAQDLGSKAPARRLETFNDALVAQWRLGKVEDLRFPGAGGRPVQMYVVHPPDEVPGKRYPLVQLIHGGPHSAWQDQFGWRWNPHVFAAQGYVVALVNYHGSTGFGDAFVDAIHGRYGAQELVDLEQATDLLIQRGLVDPERLAAAGGSYGGFLVNFINGKTDRYKALVCHAGVYDWGAHMLASDGVKGRDRALGGFPWEHPEAFRTQNPSAGRWKTPTLVIHGEQDFRVTFTQGLATYNTLRMRGVPSRLLVFPDENHWVLKPQNHLLWSREVAAWIGRYVPAGGR